MSYPEKRSIVYLVSTVVMTLAYTLWIWWTWGTSLANPGREPLWALILLGFVAVYVVLRIVLHIGFVILNKILTDEDPDDIDDEREQQIQIKASRLHSGLLMAGLGLGLVSQAAGLPSSVLYASLGASLLVATLSLDSAVWVFQRRGV